MQHRLDEIFAERAEHPGGAHDDVPAGDRPDMGLAGGFALCVDADRADRVVLAIGPVGGTIEDIVGREMHQRQADLGAGGGEVGGAVGVGREGPVALPLGPVDLGMW